MRWAAAAAGWLGWAWAPRDAAGKRARAAQLAANAPCEDRWATAALPGGLLGAVFDGHGGWQVAELAARRLPELVREELARPGAEAVEARLAAAFARVEAELEGLAAPAYALGLEQAARVGACALLAVALNGRLYVANAGDSRGLLLAPGRAPRKLNRRNSANSKREQAALRARFPAEAEIVRCRRPDACYVRGRLQPTRALGDLGLKHARFNNPGAHPNLRRLEPFAGGYVRAEPEVRAFELRGDETALLATDGLWDELSVAEVAAAWQAGAGPRQLVEEALRAAATRHGLSAEKLRAAPPGKSRRRLHDDVTVLALDLRGMGG